MFKIRHCPTHWAAVRNVRKLVKDIKYNVLTYISHLQEIKMGVTSWKVSELMIRGCGVNPGKVMVQFFFSFQVQSVSVKKMIYPSEQQEWSVSVKKMRYTERIACILCMHLGACRFFTHPTALMHLKKWILIKCILLHFIFLAHKRMGSRWEIL